MTVFCTLYMYQYSRHVLYVYGHRGYTLYPLINKPWIKIAWAKMILPSGVQIDFKFPGKNPPLILHRLNMQTDQACMVQRHMLGRQQSLCSQFNTPTKFLNKTSTSVHT